MLVYMVVLKTLFIKKNIEFFNFNGIVKIDRKVFGGIRLAKDPVSRFKPKLAGGTVAQYIYISALTTRL